jgi:hypothetical protein
MKAREGLWSGLAALLLAAAAVVVSAYAQDSGILTLPGARWWEASQVMNLGDKTAEVTFVPVRGYGMSEDLTAASKTITITSQGSDTFLSAYEDGMEMDDGFKGSAYVMANQPILGIGSIANNLLPYSDVGIAGGRAAAQYSAVPYEAAANRLAFPVVKNKYKGKTTTFYVQTLEPGTVNATYAINRGQNIYTIAITTELPGQMVTFSPSDAGVPHTCNGKPSGSGFTCLGAVIFESNVKLVGVYVEHEGATETVTWPAQIALSTRGFTPDDFDTEVLVPVIKSMWRGRTTGIQIQNVGTACSTVTFTLAYQSGIVSDADGSEIVFKIEPGASDTFFPGNHELFVGPLPTDTVPIADEFLGSATIVSDQPMTVIVNENDFAAANVSKQTVFAAFPEKSATDTVLFPLVKEAYQQNVEGNNTGLQVMNVGDTAVSLRAVYVFNKGTFTLTQDAAGQPIVIEPARAFTFYGVTQHYWDNGEYGAYTNDVGAATIIATPVEAGSTAQIVGIAQEAEVPPGGGLDYLDTKNYEGFNQ